MKNILATFILIISASMLSAMYPAKIKQYNGAPSLFINNKAVYPMVFRSWPLKPEDEKKLFSAMSKARVKIYFTYIDFGKFWKGENSYNYSEIDRKIKQVTNYAPNAWIIPVISLHHNMFWWYYKNLDQRTIDGLAPNQKAPIQSAYACISFASDKFKKESAVAIRKLLKYIEKHKAANQILGYQVGHGAYEEWIPWGLNKRKFIDFNPAYITQFRQWLKKKYLSENELRLSWNNNKVSFATAKPFLGKNIKAQNPDQGRFIDPAKKKQMLDNREFLSELITSTALFYGGVIKKATKGKALVGIYSGANYQYQHLNRILKSKDIDFLCSSTGYGDRGANGVTYDQCFTLASVKVHNKIYLHDADIRTYLFPAYKSSHFGGMTDFGRLNNPHDTVMVLRREWGAMLVHGYGVVWLNIARNPMFYCPIIMRDICRMDKAGKASMAFNRDSNAQIAIIARQRPTHYASFYGAGAVRSQLYRIGTPADIYSNEDINLISPGKYKLIVVVFSQLLTQSERKALDKLKAKGTTILWSLGTGYLTERGFSIPAMNKLTGFDFEKRIGDLPTFKLSGYSFKYLKPNRDFSVRGMIMGQHGVAYFTVKDEPKVVAFGKTDQGSIAFAKRKFTNWTSVCYPGYIVPGAIIREIAAQAGVHIYSNSDNGFYANRNFLIVSSSEDGGKKRISLPHTMTVYDIFGEKIVVKNKKSFTINMAPHTTGVYFIGNKKQIAKFKKLYLSPVLNEKAWTWTQPDTEKYKFSYFDKRGVLDVMTGKNRKIMFRLASNVDNLNGSLSAKMPVGWKYKTLKLSQLKKHEIRYVKIAVKVPVNTRPGKYHINVKFNAGKLGEKVIPVEIQVSPFTYISDLNWKKATSGWKQVLKDKSVSGKAIVLSGKKYRKGLGAHADSELVYSLKGKWKRFQATIGINDCAGKGRAGRASAIFEIIGDGQKLYSSEKMFGREAPKQVNINIEGVKTLKLITKNSGDGKVADHTDWAEARLY